MLLIARIIFLCLMPFTSFAAPRFVAPLSGVAPGTIVIKAKERALYFSMPQGAIRYPVAVPKRGMEWSGWARVMDVQRRPGWAAPAIVRRDHPELPAMIAGGDPRNPMGEGAISLDREEIAIHGTSASMRHSIGSAASYGCIRMLNEDWLDLAARVGYGTPVLMVR